MPDSEKILRLSEIFNVTTDYLLKGKETDPMDIYAQHASKAGADMSAEVQEILDNVHQMSTKRRYLLGAGILLSVIAVVAGIVFLI